MTTIIVSILVLTIAGLLIGLLLGVAGKKLEVQVDERVAAVRDVLPGNNCGGCGYPGCDGVAEAIVAGEAPVNACPVGGSSVAKAIGSIMGQDAGEDVRKVAFVKCAGDCDKANNDYVYTGLTDCTMMAFVPNGGPKHCNYGCMGYGSCVKACKFDAIHVVNGIAVVDKEACKACGACAAACPKGLIEMVPYDSTFFVRCASKDKGKAVMEGCEVGCIGCKKCEKNCPAEAIKVVDNIAKIDYALCQNCGKCVEGCPKHCIVTMS